MHRKSMYYPVPSSAVPPLTVRESSTEYDNSTVGEEEHFEIRHIWEALLDWQVWLHILIYMSIITPRMSLPVLCYLMAPC